jgi:fructose-bisphosphate aldolase class II/tagatose 1,6-diphosphate aldolase GatY/KbaY
MKNKFNEINKSKGALLATNFYNFETLKGVLLAAKDQNSPIILQMTKSSIDYLGIDNAVAMARAGLKSFGIEGWLHLDHGPDIELVKACLEAGFDSVMYDGSELPLRKNIENTKKVVQLANEYGANVEAELGYIAKLGQSKDKIEHTSVRDAKVFVEETGVDTLAVAIGSSHGFYKQKPKLDFDRLKEIKDAVKIPLVLHGGSGIPVEDVRIAIENGICKVNVATEIKNIFMQTLKDLLKQTDEIDLRKVFPIATNAVKELVEGKLKMVNFK